MNIEDLQRSWQQLDNKLERSLKQQEELLRLTAIRPAIRRLHRLAIWPVIDLVFAAVVLLIAGSFAFDHRDQWSLLMPAVVVMASSVALLASSIGQLVFVFKIDWTNPIVDIQSSLAHLRMARISQFKWIILFSPLAGFCALIVGLQCLLDQLPEPPMILDKLDFNWVMANYVFGVLFIFFGHALITWISKRFRGQSWWHHALDDISGSSLKKIEQELQRWNGLKASVAE